MQTSLYNLSYLNFIFSGNKEDVRTTIIEFMTLSDDTILNIEKCIREKNLEELKEVVHCAKPGIQMLNINLIEEINKIEGWPFLFDNEVINSSFNIISVLNTVKEMLQEEIKAY